MADFSKKSAIRVVAGDRNIEFLKLELPVLFSVMYVI